MGIESNIKASFRDVKMEIISMKSQLLSLAEGQKEIWERIEKLEKKSTKTKGTKKKK